MVPPEVRGRNPNLGLKWCREREEAAKAHALRMANLVKEELHQHRTDVARIASELNTELTRVATREAELARLKDDYAKLSAVVGTQTDADEAGAASLAEAAARVELADELCDGQEAEAEVLNHMIGRLRQNRAHLEAKLAYMRSTHIDLTVRSQAQEEAMKVATAAEDRMTSRLNKERHRVLSQERDHGAKREAMKAKLHHMGAAKRRASVSMGGSGRGGPTEMSHAALVKQLQEAQRMLAEAQLELDDTATAAAEEALKRATEAYNAAVGVAQGAKLPSDFAARLAASLKASKHADEAREAWQRLVALTQSETVDGVWAYWTEKMEARAVLQRAAEDRAEIREDHHRQLDKLNVQYLAVRDLAEAVRLEFDARLSAKEEERKEAHAVMRKWAKRFEERDTLCDDAARTLNRCVRRLTHAAVLERLPTAANSSVSKLKKQLDDVKKLLNYQLQADKQQEEKEEKEASAEVAEGEASGAVTTTGAAATSSGVITSGLLEGIDAARAQALGVTEMRAAHASLLCSTSALALGLLVDKMGWTEKELEYVQPTSAPQLEDEEDRANNTRMVPNSFSVTPVGGAARGGDAAAEALGAWSEPPDDANRMSFKVRELKTLQDKLGAEEGQRRAALKLKPSAKPKPKQEVVPKPRAPAPANAEATEASAAEPQPEQPEQPEQPTEPEAAPAAPPEKSHSRLRVGIGGGASAKSPGSQKSPGHKPKSALKPGNRTGASSARPARPVAAGGGGGRAASATASRSARTARQTRV